MYTKLLFVAIVAACGKANYPPDTPQDVSNTEIDHNNIPKPQNRFNYYCCTGENNNMTRNLNEMQYRNHTGSENQKENKEEKGQVNTVKATRIRRRVTPIMFMVPQPKTGSENDVCSDSSEEFPEFLSKEQLANGAVVICFLIGIYCFSFLAIVCDKYFLPCVERICEVFNLPQDVAGATFMSMATSAPELFVNIIGTFITESDIGIGTVVGSNLYNTLGVAALGSLAASVPIQLDWWPVTRDCVIYICSVTLLVAVAWDGYVYWYEAMVLIIAFCLYLIVQFNSKNIAKHVVKWVENRKISTVNLVSNEIVLSVSSSLEEVVPSESRLRETANNSYDGSYTGDVKHKEAICAIPKGSWWSIIFYIYLWPIRTILSFTVPNPKTNPKLFPVTFVFCVVLIGLNSYVVSWMLTLIGAQPAYWNALLSTTFANVIAIRPNVNEMQNQKGSCLVISITFGAIGGTFAIPDAILGLTFLAAGGGLPESMSIVIMSRRGEGSIGVSNALGANSINILMSLGFPWFISSAAKGFDQTSYVEIASGSIHYTILGLLLVICSLFVTLYFNKFRLSRPLGVVLSVVYLTFLTLAVLSEMFLIQTESC